MTRSGHSVNRPPFTRHGSDLFVGGPALQGVLGRVEDALKGWTTNEEPRRSRSWAGVVLGFERIGKLLTRW
jgi:hypothetical protein